MASTRRPQDHAILKIWRARRRIAFCLSHYDHIRQRTGVWQEICEMQDFKGRQNAYYQRTRVHRIGEFGHLIALPCSQPQPPTRPSNPFPSSTGNDHIESRPTSFSAAEWPDSTAYTGRYILECRTSQPQSTLNNPLKQKSFCLLKIQ